MFHGFGISSLFKSTSMSITILDTNYSPCPFEDPSTKISFETKGMMANGMFNYFNS
jgi:hypothetical protein